MDDRNRDGRLGEEDHIHRLATHRKRHPRTTHWHWLDALTPADLDSELIEAVEERVEDQERPRLESLFD